jgi:hypothetical protein
VSSGNGRGGGVAARLWFALFALAGLGAGVWLFERRRKRTRGA